MALYGDKLIDIDNLQGSLRVCATKLDSEFCTLAVGDRHEAHRCIGIQEVLYLVARLQLEALHIVILLLAIVVAQRVYPIATIAFNTDSVVGEVLLDIEVGDIVLILRCPHHDAVFTLELTKKLTTTIGIETANIIVIPYILATECRCALLFKDNLAYRVARNEVTYALATLDSKGREVEVYNTLLKTRTGAKINLEYLGLAIGIYRQIQQLALGRALS